MKAHLVSTSLVGVTLALALGGCSQDNAEVVRRLDAISARIDKLAAGAPAGNIGQPPPQQRPGPDPAKTYAVPTDDLPSVGNPNAPVTLVKAYEYACPFCEKVRPTEEQLLQDYGDKIRIVYAPYVVHPQLATLPMQTSCAAYRQGKFQQMNELLWEKAFKTRQFDQSNMDALAKEAGLDPAQYAADSKGGCPAWVNQHQGVMSGFGVNATPTFFINGRVLAGAQPLPAFKALIDEELKKAEGRIADGTPAAAYYKTWVLDKGLKKLDGVN